MELALSFKKRKWIKRIRGCSDHVVLRDRDDGITI